MSVTTDKYRQWLNHPHMDVELKAELEVMSPDQIHDAFYTDVEFGTAGMRGLLGAGTNRLNVYTVRKATLGLARYLNSIAAHPTVAIAYDNRHNSDRFAEESAKILAANGIESYVFESLRSTPELSYAVRYLKCTSGIMITASHNPKEYNGYKVYDDTGCQMIPEMVAHVIEEIQKLGDEFVDSPELSEAQKQMIHTISREVDDPYLKEVESIQLNPDLSKDNFKMVFTPQHGTSIVSLRELFTRLGYDVTYVEEQCTPDPDFSKTIIPNPEDPRSLVTTVLNMTGFCGMRPFSFIWVKVYSSRTAPVWLPVIRTYSPFCFTTTPSLSPSGSVEMAMSALTFSAYSMAS